MYTIHPSHVYLASKQSVSVLMMHAYFETGTQDSTVDMPCVLDTSLLSTRIQDLMCKLQCCVLANPIATTYARQAQYCGGTHFGGFALVSCWHSARHDQIKTYTLHRPFDMLLILYMRTDHKQRSNDLVGD